MRFVLIFVLGGYMALNYSEVASFVMQASEHFMAVWALIADMLASSSTSV